MSHIFVPVVDQEHKPLMPTTPSRARRWIGSGKATGFWKGAFFCVRLNNEPSAREKQSIAMGIDPGSKREGIVVASATHTYANVHTEARTGVKEAEQDSTRMRRTRRQRKAQYISLKDLPQETQRREDQASRQNRETAPQAQRAAVEAPDAFWVCTCCRSA